MRLQRRHLSGDSNLNPGSATRRIVAIEPLDMRAGIEAALVRVVSRARVLSLAYATQVVYALRSRGFLTNASTLIKLSVSRPC